ncbi:MAG: type IV toxin-antitoxin system AbiEi family antitoxin domain-containing protein [Solirubrobacterales bacterium]|nr:type IV toxin-antitoxin system AbiEi family antitoxin domain-containing protein [Solirubrobacterales bacterium]MBV9535654.1 type IV toxin-antitoxin system AbiEi family antitoxin domain-containing protein [Solirubrobacterales bacterium]
MPVSIEGQIAALADRQHGNVTREQLLRLGCSEDQIDRQLKDGRLHRVHRGVYAVGRPARTALERASAAVLACGAGAALSHSSALALWELQDRWPRRFEVTVPGHRRPSEIRTHCYVDLERRDLRRHKGIRVTSPARALLDCAPRLSDKRLPRAVNEARRRGLIGHAELADVIVRSPRHRGARRLAQFALFPREQVIVELDSWAFHSTREAFERDRERDVNTLAAGFATIRLTWQRMHRRPRDEAARLHQILKRRRPRAA